MSDRQTLGELLERLGRISSHDRERALAYQQAEGGYFGEALVALGVISQGELDYGLAAQFDLPYVFPEPESIDEEAARMVGPEWALAHLTLPISRAGNTLSVVVDSPLKPEMMEELSTRTGLEVELAITSAARIRELIRHVFGSRGEDPRALHPALAMDDFLDQALASGAIRMGVSLRGRRVVGWWEEGGRMHRARIPSGWPGALGRRLSGGLGSAPPASPEVMETELEWGGSRLPATLRRISTPEGEELLLELRVADEAPIEVDPPPASFVEEVRLLERAGAGRFLVRSHPSTLARELLPHLPRLLLGAHVRGVHLGAGDPGPGTLRLDFPPVDDPEAGGRFLSQLRPFRFEALTAHLPTGTPAPLLGGVLRAAGSVFLTLEPPPRSEGAAGAVEREAALRSADPALGWLLEIRREEGGRLDWRLLPLRPAPSMAGA